MKTLVCVLTGIIMALIAIAHLLRLIYGWEVTFEGIVLPMWPSIIGVIVPGLLAIGCFMSCKCVCKTE